MWGAVTACKKTAEDIEVAFKVSDLWRVCCDWGDRCSTTEGRVGSH